jgi:hypothetical protein
MNTKLTNFYAHLNESVITTDDFENGTKFRKREKVGDNHARKKQFLVELYSLKVST